MSYGHHFRCQAGTSKIIPPECRERAVPIVRDILDRYQNIITGDRSGQTILPPRLDETCILFNGIGEDRCETFRISLQNLPDEIFSCETDRKPYDAVVMEILIVLRHFFTNFIVTSDGFSDPLHSGENWYTDQEWLDAASRVRERYGSRFWIFINQKQRTHHRKMGTPQCWFIPCSRKARELVQEISDGDTDETLPAEERYFDEDQGKWSTPDGLHQVFLYESELNE